MAEAINQQDTIIQNTFEGGMNLDGDRRPELNPKNAYTFALNAVNKTSHSSQVIGLSNEASFSSCPGVPQNAIGLALVEERNWSVFITPEAGGTVGIHDHRSCETEILFSGSEFSCDFGCTDCEWIGNNMEFKTMDPCSELHMYWSCGCNYYKVNIDLMRDPARKAGLMREINCNSCKDKQDCKVFEIFKCACSPKMSPKAYQSGGGTLPAGAYQFVLRYQYVDSGWTNWFNHSDPVFIGSEHNVGGEQGNGHIELSMSCLDCNMAAVEIAVIERIGGVTTAKLLDKVYLNNESYSYNYTGQEGTDITIEELLVKDKTYIKGKHLEQHKSRMLYYGLKHFKNLNYQYKANGISVGYNIYEMPFEQACKHNIRGLMRGETYAFGIVWNYKDGSHSRVFHIPGAPSGGNSDNGLSQTFKDTFNPSPFGDGSNAAGTANIDAAGNTNTDQDVVCEFEDVSDDIDISYNSLLKAGEADILDLYITGNTSSTDILECIKECIDSGKSTRIYVTGHNGDEITFDAYSYTQTADSNLSLLGNTNTTAVGDARHIAVIHKEGTATGPTPGGSGSGGSGGGGQSQISGNPTVSITTPSCVVRKRSHIPDQVSDPQQDDWDDKIQEMLSKLETVVEDECEELRLIEDARRAECCQCRENATIYPPESCGPDGSINVSVAGDPDTGEGAVSVSGTIPADCAAPFVCCETGPMCEPGKAYEQCMEDLNDLDHGAADYASVLEDYLLDELDVTFNATSMNDAAVIIMNAIQQRERKYRKQQEFNVSKSVSYGGGGTDPRDGDSRFGDIYTDCCGNRDSDLDLRIVSSGKPTPKYEKDITYPCSTDCSGNPLYGGLADTPVSHSQFPDACQEPHYVAKSIGVPHGTYWGDANEYGDGYVRIMGPTFDNITFPTEQELPKDLCERNPYTIVMVKRTDSNKEILLKGLATGTFLIDNNGKQYEQPRHGVNSIVEVSRYHDGGGKHPRLSNGGSGSSFNIFSLDGCTRKPALDADVVIEELRLTGKGERYGLYAMGDLPLDQENGQRVDKLGARQAVNLNQWSAGGCSEIPLDFKIYAPSRGSNVGGGIAPPAGGSTPLMQAFQQESIWIGAGLPQIIDHSFQGDVLEHNAPINYAEASYVTLKKNRDNQYGNLENLNYIPILQAGKNNGGSIEGAVGDTYIGPYSFVKTGYVSDKVGSCEPDCKFNIPAQEPTKKERRCVCDSPEDVIHNYTKGHIWSKLPESGDVANPWNWAGTHTHGLNHTDLFSEAEGTQAVSGYYAPKTVTTNITFWQESETNPWLRQKSDLLREQWYPEISKEFHYDAGVEVDANGGKWNDSWLTQFGCERRQPSQKQEKQLAMWRTVLTVIGPMLMALGMGKSNDTFALTGQLASSGYFASMWHMLNQVLYDNQKLEEILGIPACKSDDVGGQGDGCIRGFFTNPCGYNFDYSAMNEIYPYCGMPDIYYVCQCDDCSEENQTSNEIYYSEEQVQGSKDDAYGNIKPLNKVTIDPSEGKLTNLISQGNTLYYHTTDVFRPLAEGRVLLASNIGEVLLGTGGFLQHTGGGGPIEGYAGLQHHNHQINTQYGYFWVDQEAAKIFRLHNNSIDVISDKSAFNFFKEHLPFCEETECKNEQKAGTSYYALGVDPRLNRFLITKNDGNNQGSFTLSYDLERDHWISFHSYDDVRAYNWDRYNSYALTPQGYWKMNDTNCDFGNFCSGRENFEVRFSAASPRLDEFQYRYTDVDLLVEECSGCVFTRDIDNFFDEIALYNSTESTGWLTSDIRSDNRGSDESAIDNITDLACGVKIDKRHRHWRFNQIHDKVDVDCGQCVPMLECDECEPFPRLNQGIINCDSNNKQDYKNRHLSDRFVTYWYVWDHAKRPQQNITLLRNTTYTDEHID